ncbi:MAG: undecaprenyl-diphosphate phosphatase [Hydrotalea flava]|uniref:undecaprenyl-diphosphate phosphatase n=1 Tax=Hydrotalea TaxID=1004300 RepID=UPI00169515E5|nr:MULTISPECIES: undecaprenyl-diphosphate phosphatase [Hydrotalea]NIM35428.1 undecaprenyl-diphosphate phosphatase [Hydrotalea flava]NIM38286.1 undecaprenyl-diphosphate phosphatase [Hydrotalea flava]NIN03457.1 undecaprenyl-diphosphate phosphatase [Hydrotalea flava]NIN15144.1 undecaprenyl-diphosphate phosphatase [Hydrotalea flava]NIO94212.1 undecaprenyl-diphosphate phosphatase [Hydrotalea flava]
MNLVQVIIEGIIEGITEFLPVSSTGHMIIASSVMHIEKDAFTKMFEIAIQLGAILSVVVLYWRKFFDFSRWQFYVKLIVAVIPALVLGKLFADKIDLLLESPTTVAVSLLAGGIVLLFIDRFFRKETITTETEISYKKGFIIGIWQCLAMIPGVSRSAASIIGGMQQNLTRKLAAEFSFYLAVPTMAAATGYKMLKTWQENPEVVTNTHNMQLLAIGNIIAFIVAMLAIKFFISYLQKHGFKLFGWYRIVVGIVVLVLIYTGNL